MLRTLWNPVPVQINQLPRALDHLLKVEFRETKLSMTCVHAVIVLVDSEHVDLRGITFFFIRLGTFETLNTVVQCCIRWIQVQLLKRLNLWLLPAAIIPIVVANQHVVSKEPSKYVLMVLIWLWLLVL